VIYSTDPIFSSGRPRVLYVCFPYEVIRRMTCSIQDEHVMSCDVTTFCYTCAFRMSNMQGKDTLHSKRSVSEVGRCPCSGKQMDIISIVNGNVCERFHECWHERFVVFCDLLQVH
jgi:hypothetical protein